MFINFFLFYVMLFFLTLCVFYPQFDGVYCSQFSQFFVTARCCVRNFSHFYAFFFNLEYTYNNISSYIYKYYNLPNSTMPMHFMRCFRVFSFCFEFLWVVSLAEVCTATTTMHCVINGGKNPLLSSVNANRARSSVVIAATRTWF